MKQPARGAPKFKPAIAPLKFVQRKAAPLQPGPTFQTRKPPVAPPVYRPQPNPNSIQRKTVTFAQPRTPPPAPPVHRPESRSRITSPTKTPELKHQSAIQAKHNPKAPAVYKPVPPKFGPPKPPAPKFSPGAPPRQVAVQAKMRNGAAIKPALTNRSLARPANIVRHGAIQLRPMGRDLRTWYLRQPNGDEQQEVHAKCSHMLARYADEEVGDTLMDGRINIASLLLREFGGGENFYTRMMAYFLGLRRNMPAAQVTGLGTLGLDEGGQVVGRPGFLKTSLAEHELVGAPGRAFRHKTAWHNIRKLLNSVLRDFGPGQIGNIVDKIAPRLPAHIVDEAQKVVRSVQAASMIQQKILWLAVVLNSSPSNLWLGPAKENISINSAGSHLARWTEDLDAEDIDLDTYHTKVRTAQFGSAKARRVREIILQIIREARVDDDPVTFTVQRVKHEALSQLEIDLRSEDERHDAPHHLRIYQIANEVGGLADHENLIEALLFAPV